MRTPNRVARSGGCLKVVQGRGCAARATLGPALGPGDAQTPRRGHPTGVLCGPSLSRSGDFALFSGRPARALALGPGRSYGPPPNPVSLPYGQPCACTPDFAGFARLGSALGPGESPRERQPFGRALRNPPKWAAAISSGCLRIRFQSSCRFPYSYRVTTSFELPYTDSRNPPYLRM